MFMKFKSRAEADVELQRVLSKAASDPSVTADTKQKAAQFWAMWKEDKDHMLKAVVGLEREAMSAGYPLAVGFVSGACQVCEKCSGVETGICIHQDKAQLWPHGSCSQLQYRLRICVRSENKLLLPCLLLLLLHQN